MRAFVSNLRPAEIAISRPPPHRKDPPMRANVGYQGLDADWTRVSHAEPCPICRGFGQCRTHVEEEFACCVHEPSEWRLANGGWLHRIERTPVVVAARRVRVVGERLGDAPPGIVS
jgi:hypothetical protein